MNVSTTMNGAATPINVVRQCEEDKEQGEVWHVVPHMEKWANRAENILRAARQEKQGKMPVIDLSDVQDDS